MSLRNSPQLSPSLLDAARSNARHSTGPRSEAGKQISRMNALKHGERSDPENHYDVMRALGEDPARFEALKQELSASFDTSDAFTERQVDDLARLYQGRDRLERAQTGLACRALLALEDREHRRRKEIEGVTMEVDQAINTTIAEPSDRAARLRLLLSFLALIRLQVHLRSFLPWQAAALDAFYQTKGGWRAARLCWLLALFAGNAGRPPQADRGAPPVDSLADEEADAEEAFVDAQAEGTGGADVPLLGTSATRGWRESGNRRIHPDEQRRDVCANPRGRPLRTNGTGGRNALQRTGPVAGR